MSAFKGKCPHCGRDDDFRFHDHLMLLLSADTTRFLQENRRYLAIIDTDHPDPEYKYEWDVVHWIGKAFNQHIHGRVVKFQMMPLPNANEGIL